MGKISDYTRVLVSKLADVFVVDQTDNGTTETKSATVEQIGAAIGTLQNFADLDTSNKNLVDAINEIASYTPVYGNPASGSIATFDTSLALPLQDCTIAINGTDLTGANVTQCGKNFMSFNSVSLGGSNPRTTARIDIDTIPAGTYTISFTNSGTGTTLGVQLFEQSSGGTAVANFTTTGSYTFTLPTSAKSIYMFMTTQEYNDGKTISINDFQIELGTTATAYEAYNGTIYPISWNDLGTVSEGSLNVIMGKLTVVNGSMGAGEYQITPIPINQISGTNNVFCDTGNTSVMYACSLKDYIDSQ